MSQPGTGPVARAPWRVVGRIVARGPCYYFRAGFSAYTGENKMHESLGFQAVESIRPGEYVRRTEHAKKTYVRDAYNPSTRRYMLADCDDINRTLEVKKGTVLHVGFTY